jgi:hypothetical protein
MCSYPISSSSRSTFQTTHGIVPKVNLLSSILNLLDLLRRELEFPQLGVSLDPLFILGRSNSHDTRLHGPSKEDGSGIDIMGLGDLVKDWLEGSTRVSNNGGKGSVSLGDDIVLFVDIENGSEVSKEVWVEFELYMDQLGTGRTLLIEDNDVR